MRFSERVWQWARLRVYFFSRVRLKKRMCYFQNRVGWCIMAKRRGRKVQFKLSVGEDSSLWRFASVQEALRANTELLSHLIKAAETQHVSTDDRVAAAETFPVPESA